MYKFPFFRRISIYPKLVLAFVTVMTPLYLVSLGMNEYASRNAGQKINDTIDSQLSFYMRLLEVEFSKMLLFQKEFINDGDLLELSGGWTFMSAPDRTAAILSLQHKMLLLKYSSSYISDVYAYLPVAGRVISTTDLYSNYNPDVLGQIRRASTTGSSPFTYEDGNLEINMTAPGWSVMSNNDPIYLISIEISVNMIRNFLKQLAVGDKSVAILIDTKAGWSVASDDAGMSEVEGKAAANGDSLFTASTQSTMLGLTLRLDYPYSEVFGALDLYQQWYWVLSALSVILILLFASWIYRVIHRPLKKLVMSFRRLETGDMKVRIEPLSHDEFGYLYNRFNVTVQRLDISIQEMYLQKYRAQLSEFKQLQTQINPHFLYNSFFNLQLMAKLKDWDSIVHFTTCLGEYFRYITRNAADEAYLEDEVRHVRHYTEIQSLRFSNRITVDFQELPNEARRVMVPKLILQPLIENAYKYGLESKKTNGRLRIAFELHRDAVYIAVEDNGDGLRDETIRTLNNRMDNPGTGTETTGLLNVCRRLQIRFRERGGIRVSRGELGGLLVEIRLPTIGGSAIDVQTADRG